MDISNNELWPKIVDIFSIKQFFLGNDKLKYIWKGIYFVFHHLVWVSSHKKKQCANTLWNKIEYQSDINSWSKLAWNEHNALNCTAIISYAVDFHLLFCEMFLYEFTMENDIFYVSEHIVLTRSTLNDLINFYIIHIWIFIRIHMSFPCQLYTNHKLGNSVRKKKSETPFGRRASIRWNVLFSFAIIHNCNVTFTNNIKIWFDEIKDFR